MANKQRPIDAPAPPWRLMPTGDPTGEHSMEPTDAPEVDKAALAKQLAEKAKAELAAKKEAEAQAKVDKAELARQLVEKAKAEQAAKKAEAEAAVAAERQKKAELAKRLVEQAKKASSQSAEPRAATPAGPAKGPKPAKPAEDASLASRAGRPKAKKLSAQEALAAAIAAEEAAEAAAPEPTPEPPAEIAPQSEAVTEDATHPAAVAALSHLPRGVVGREPVAITRIPVFKALWKAHRSKAQKEGDAGFVATASVLLDAVNARPLTAVEVQLGSTSWAVFVDEAGNLLGAVQPADTYLAGL